MVFEQEVNIRSGKLKSALRNAETSIEQLSDSIALKASASDVYTKDQTQAILEVKANKDTLISEINASADQVKINADRININGVVTVGGIARTSDIPTNVSELNNDRGYATSSDIPTKVSDLTNDSGYATEDQIPTNLSDLANDTNYATISQVPSKVSQLTNDSGFQNARQVDTTITGKGYATTTQAQDYASSEVSALKTDLASGVGTTVINGGHITTGTIDASVVNVTNIKASEIKSGKITASQINSDDLHVKAANIDGTLTASQINAHGLSLGMNQITGLSTALDGKQPTGDYATRTQAQGYADTAEQNAKDAIPTNVSDLTNDSGFQNATQVNTAITSKGYQTSQQVESAITGKGYQTSAQVETAITSKDYATNTALDNEATARAEAVAEAAKTATDYLHFESSTGLDVGSNDSDSKVNIHSDYGVRIYDEDGKERNQINSDGMSVKDGNGNTIARFGSIIDLGLSGTHQVRISDQTIDFVEQGKTMAYMAEDKGYFTNQEIGDALYLGNYSLRQNSEGKLVIGRRR